MNVSSCTLFQQPENTDLITTATAIYQRRQQSLCPNDRDLIQEAEQIANKYNTLLKLFEACHRGMNTRTFLDDSVIDKLDKSPRDHDHTIEVQYLNIFLNNWLKDHRISTGNEREARKLQDNAIKDSIAREWLPLQQGSSDTGIEIKQPPVVSYQSQCPCQRLARGI